MVFDTLRQDLRFGVRQLQRAPLFTVIASFSVAVGVIVAVSAFSLMNTLLFKTLPVPNPDGIYHLYTSDYDGREDPWGSSSYRDYEDFVRTGSFAGLGASAAREVAVAVGNEPPIEQFLTFVSPNFFDVLGLRLEGGSFFRGGHALEIVITYPYWQRSFGGEASAIGQTVRVNSMPLTIVGVAPESFRGVDLGPPIIGWTPASVLPMLGRDAGALTQRGERGFRVFGRLRAGETAEPATQRLNALAASLAEQEPDSWVDRNRETRLVSVLPHRESYIPPQMRSGLWLAFGMGILLVAFVVLLACTNVAALMLGRAAGRENEIAVRLTLGATRARLVQQLLTESVLIAAIGGTLSFLGLLWTLSLIRRQYLTDLIDLSPDWRVVLVAVGVSLLCALVFGLAPVLQSRRVDLRSRFGGTATVQRNRMRGVLIALQVAIASVLILLASSAVRGVRAYVASDPGIELDGLVAMEIDTRLFGDDTARRSVYLTQVRELLTGLPAVKSAASTVLLPLGDGNTGAYVDFPSGEERVVVEVNTVGADFFATVGVLPLRGRAFQPTDRRGSAPVAVVNRAFLQRYGGALFGGVVKVEEQAGIQIVGVVPEIHYHDPRAAAQPLIYLVDEQVPWGSSRRRFLLRVAPGNERLVANELRRELLQRFPDLVIPSIAPMRDHTARQTMPHRMAGRVALGIGGVELALASIGLYGLLVFALFARRREIGVRLALGATAHEASWAVMRDGVRYAAFGSAAGILLAIPATFIVQQAIPGARVSDPAPFIVAMVSVLAVVGVAAYLPARKAGQVQPADALRHD
ncbi:MAG: ABC transporter permease [Gemmatimonadota bacterium]